MNRKALFAALLLASIPPAASGWDNVETHRELTRAALTRANSEGEIDQYFREALGLDSISESRLPLVIGYDDEIDQDIGPQGSSDGGSDVSRLNCSLNQSDDNCVRLAIPVEDRTRMSAMGCDAGASEEGDSCDRYSVAKLLRVGSYAEDSPTPRASGHFFEPLGQTGLDNSTVLLGGIDVLAADSVTTAFYGGKWLRFVSALLTWPGVFFGLNVGNFDLDGDPAPDWALGTSAPPDNFIENLFSSADAERYLFRALTAPTPLERDHYLGLHVLAVGHVAHVLEDMGNPAHTRNDFVVDHVWHRGEDLEFEGKGGVRDRPCRGCGSHHRRGAPHLAARGLHQQQCAPAAARGQEPKRTPCVHDHPAEPADNGLRPARLLGERSGARAVLSRQVLQWRILERSVPFSRATGLPARSESSRQPACAAPE